MAYLEIINGPQAGQKTYITQETFFIGRESTNHLVVTDRTISRKHAVINQVEGQYVISDLKSLKGLLVNGSKKEEATLEDGDEITFGAVRLHFYLVEKGKEATHTGGSPPLKKWFWVGGVGAVLLAVILGVFLLRPSTPHDEKGLKQHYLKGVELFNRDHDPVAARREWNEVLKQDPNKTTVYGQKASKLLESIPDR